MTKDQMTKKERMLTAMKNEVPDRVPISPDMSNMIPAKLTGKPFWDIYYYNNPPLWKAYIDAIRYYDTAGWFWYVGLGESKNDQRKFRDEIVSQDEEKMVVRTYCETPEGELWQETVYRRNDPPVVTRKYIKDLKRDFKHLKYFYPDPRDASDEEFQEAKKLMGDNGIVGFWVHYPELMFDLRDGQENVYYDYYDNYDLVKEWAEMWGDYSIKYLERALGADPDYIQTGHSGTLTLQSPEIFRDIGLETLQKITKMCKEAGVPTMLHSCGYEKELVKICAEETDLNAINPLEEPPMGDCNLDEIKQLYGDKLALMGNIHTTKVMLKGTPAEVDNAVKKAIKDAGNGGGFIISTGDQCGRDTPEENLRAFYQAGLKYGQYDPAGNLIYFD